MALNRKKYTQAFKAEAVRLAETGGKSQAEIERDLGMAQGLLTKWKRQKREAGEEAFPGNGRRTAGKHYGCET